MSNIVVDLDELDKEIVPDAQPEPEPEKEPEQKATHRFDDWDKEKVTKAYSELEKLNSRQAQELGHLRQEVNQLSKTIPETQQPDKLDVDSLLDDPDRAVQESIASNPQVKALQDQLTKLQQMEAANHMKGAHPDFAEIVQTPEYQNWVMESPVRRDLHARANNYDFDAGNELLSTFKERQQYVKTEQVKEVVEDDRKRQLQAASSEGASSGSTSQKIYRQADLERLNQFDRDKYDAMLPEIERAYQEGRVK